MDICSLIPNEEADVAILEEPEHLNWLRIPQPYKESEHESQDKPESKERKGSKKKVATAKEKAELGWRFKFRHVIGISKLLLWYFARFWLSIPCMTILLAGLPRDSRYFNHVFVII